MIHNTLVIGANGGIGSAIIHQIIQTEPNTQVFGVSTTPSKLEDSRYHHFHLAEPNEASIPDCCESLPQHAFNRIVCTIGMLHNQTVQPEKRLEELSASSLQQYFETNVLLPALWLKHIPDLLTKENPSKVVFLSARVGSISDNQLGGWYGYRSSKSALNMLIKTAQVEIKRRLADCSLVLYHPGTVDTALSKPYQANVNPEKLFTPEFTAKQLLSILPELEVAHAPHYIDWNGRTIPW